MAKKLIDTNSNDMFALESDLSSKATKSSITAGTKCKITYNSEGIITSGTALATTDIPNLAASKITSGTFASARLPTATSSAKGAVMPVAKTDDMTQDVGVDSSGKLYTKQAWGAITGDIQSQQDLVDCISKHDIRMLRPVSKDETVLSLTSSFQVKHINFLGITLIGGYGTGLRYVENGVEHIAKTSTGSDMTAQRIGTFDVGKDSAGNDMIVCSVESGDPSNSLAAYWSYDGKTWTKCVFPSNTVSKSATAVRYNNISHLWTICTVDNIINGSTNRNPMCMLSDDGKNYQVGPNVGTSCTAYSVVEYEDGFVYMRSATDEEGQMIRCKNIQKNSNVWTWDIYVLANFEAHKAFNFDGDFTCRAFAYGNGFFLAGDQSHSDIAKIYPDGTYEMVSFLPGNYIRSICFNCGLFYIAAYNDVYTTITGEASDFRSLKGAFDSSKFAGSVYGIDECYGVLFLALKTKGSNQYSLVSDYSENNVSIIKSIVDSMFFDGEVFAF